ncbi:KpsF/GutQ family sugar-phosphate isomerase [Mucilaginibacter defluvii]|uniref:KpsF/GutQ family sugar-phosphate isomerase n=1 Tax=Mucilaginibacter defluvii TaxID=1196019 RepID=A0ABP9FVY3_9SPHI
MKNIAKRVFDIEIESLTHVAGLLDDAFDAAITTILGSSGKTIVTGIGKSGLIGKKIAATLASTGTPSFYMHPAEAFHGDLGMISEHDVVLLISYSGESDEVLKLIPFLKWHNNIIIGITGNPASTIAKNSHHHLNVKITREACPLELAPTSSTTAMLVMGDALAIALMEARNFKHEDFARFHPGGSLGRKLLTKVKDVMRTDNLPYIDKNASFTDLLMRMSAGRLGMVMVGNSAGIQGIVTDGDLRRALLKNSDTTALRIADIMTTSPIIIGSDELMSNAEQLMIDKKITTLLVGNAEERTVEGVYQIYNQ